MKDQRLLKCALAIYETITETGGGPSGHLYAGMMSLISLDEYNHIISCLKKANLIEENNYWLSPVKKAAVS